MNRRAGGESFHGRDFASFDLAGCNQAGADRLAIKQDGAGAAVAGVAADLGSRQSETLTQYLGEPLHRRDRSGSHALPFTENAMEV